MNNNKFVKLFRVNGTEVLVRKTFEIIEGKQNLYIQIHCYFDEFIPLGYMPEAQTKIPACCMKHLNQNFDQFDGDKAKNICEMLRNITKNAKQEIINHNINHN